MSKIIVNKKYLKTKATKDFLMGLALILLGISAIIFITDFGRKPTLYLLIPLMVMILPGAHFIVQFRKEGKNIKRDDMTLKALSSLPESYTVLRNVYIPYKKKIVECHFVVIGDNGVFIIEANGSVGALHESKEERYWLNYRMGGKSKIFVKAIHNQRALVDYKVVALAQYLLRYNVHIYAQGIVYFPSKRSEVNLLNSKAIFDQPGDLLSYITNFPPRLEIDELKKDKIERLLKLDTLVKK